MPGRRKRPPGVVLYWVVCRDEDTTELLDSHSFSTIDEARRFQIDYEERADPPGHICKVDIEVLLTGDLPQPSTILLGADATKARFTKLPLPQYNVVHLALHGYVDTEYPDRSALIFAPEKNQRDDGMLQVREIEKLRLNAGLVTLSACDTGVGPVGEDGVDNIVNAFIEAGADTVVSTLWELEDHSTEHLMAAFYSRLSKGEPKGEALRGAQAQLIKEGLQPYYWASFQLVGDPNGTI